MLVLGVALGVGILFTIRKKTGATSVPYNVQS